MWKVVAVILNHWIKSSITYHDFLNGFYAGRFTGTATLNYKLLHKLSVTMEELMYMIFMYLHKVYGDFERDTCLEILEGYGMGHQSCCILCMYWYHLWMVL